MYSIGWPQYPYTGNLAQTHLACFLLPPSHSEAPLTESKGKVPEKPPQDSPSQASLHLPMRGKLAVGAWDLRILCEQRLSPSAPADDFLITVVHGRIRIAVADPALNSMLAGRSRIAATAWGQISAELRSHPDPVDALQAANTVVFDAEAGWMGGAMLCVGVADLHPTEPVVLAAARAGDVTVTGETFNLNGSCFRPHAESRLRERQKRDGHQGPDPRRWAIQAEELAADDYTTTPIGLIAACRLEHWGPAQSRHVIVATDGADPMTAADADIAISTMVSKCTDAPTAAHASPHGDRALVSARWRG